MKLIFLPFLIGAFFLFTEVSATDYSPWYSRYLEFQPQLSYAYQFYNSVNTSNKKTHYSSNNHFLEVSLSGAYDRWSLEVESNFASTRHRTFSFSDVRLTARYQWLDDVLGDFINLVTGLTLIQDVKVAKNDISCFYHGCLESELHLAIGKETSCEQFWASRLWGVMGLGIADGGSPWVKCNLSWDHNWRDIQKLNVGLFSLWGLGGNNLNLNKPFRGYGGISHYSIDFGVDYQYFFSSGLITGASYLYRIYAHNCPRFVNTFEINVIYPFGL